MLTAASHQGVPQVPIGNTVYDFLRHLSTRGLIEDYSENELPLSEFEIAEFLRSVNVAELSESEQLQRTKYLRTFAHLGEEVTMFSADSAKPLFFDGIFTDDDKYLYRWRDDSTKSDLYVHGIASIEYRRRQEPASGSVGLGVIGGRMYGTLSGHVGYFLETTNGQDFGDSTIVLADPVIGKNNNFRLFSKKDFDFTSAELTYNYDWFTGKLAREAISIGGSYENDNVLLSPNVPYFDFVSLGAKTKAVRYQAIVASLLGDARFTPGYDSLHLQYGPGLKIDPKYLTLHDLTFMIGRDIDFGFTDMVIFTRRFDLAYVNPFSFLKSVEHSLQDRDNGLLGAHARWRIVKSVEVRGQALLDDLVASKIGTGYWSNKWAWQFGGMWAGAFGLRDLDLLAEWTRVEPYTYTHFDPQNAFTTSGSILGSQIGPNAIRYWSKLRWAPTEKLIFEGETSLIERGENIYDSTGYPVQNYGSDVERTVNTNEDKDKPIHILDGRRVNVFSVSANVQYEPWRGLTLFVRGTKKSVKYLEGTPANPKEQPETLFAIGAQGLF